MAPQVLEVRESQWTKASGEQVTTWWVQLEGREDAVPCYQREAERLQPGQPLPEGWEVRTSQQGKLYLAPPRAQRGGGTVAWKNTREGAWADIVARVVNTAMMQASTPAEAESWLRWAMDRLLELAGPSFPALAASTTAQRAAPPSGAPSRPSGPGRPTTATLHAGTAGDGDGGTPAEEGEARGCLHTNLTDRKPPAFTDPLPSGWSWCRDCERTVKTG